MSTTINDYAPNGTGSSSITLTRLTTAPRTTDITTEDANDPSKPSAAYVRMQPRWEKCRACFLGTEAIRDGGTDYLPQYAGESDDRYEVRKVLAAFDNGYALTVKATTGMLLEEAPVLGDDMPPKLVELWENADGKGTAGVVLTRRLATAGVVDGIAGLIVEYPKTDRQLSRDEEDRLKLRPYFVLVKADAIIKPIYETVQGVRTLVLLIIREVVEERRGLFGMRTIVQYRIYTKEGDVVRSQRWVEPVGGGRPTIADQPSVITNQTEIPWSPFIAGEEITPDEIKPPLSDLADLNIQYHGTLTNILSLQSLAFVPTPVRIGATPDENGDYPDLILGPENTIEAPVIEGVPEPVFWFSPPTEVLGPGERMLASTKAAMASMGAAFLSAETRAAETAEGKRIDSAASRATIATVRQALQDCLERAFQFAGNYVKEKSGSITLNDDYTGEGIDPEMLKAAILAAQSDLISLEEFRHFFQTGQLPETFDAADLKAILAQQRQLPDGTSLDDPGPPGTTATNRRRVTVRRPNGDALATLESE